MYFYMFAILNNKSVFFVQLGGPSTLSFFLKLNTIIQEC